MADDEAKVLAEAAKLPMEDRATHANWKVRSAAFDDIKNGCARIFDGSDPSLNTYGMLLVISMKLRQAWLLLQNSFKTGTLPL